MYNTKNKTQKAYKKNKPNLNLIPRNCVCVFPIEIVGGKTQVSNLGIMPNRRYYDKGSFLYWQEVFDGRSALKLQWKDSITLEKPEGQNYYLARTSIGSYYYGKPISAGTEALEISEDASFEDFMSMKSSQTVTLRFEYNPTDRIGSQEEIQSYFRFILVDNDIYNLYQIPELCENKLMYIESHQEYYDDLTGESKGCEITFATLGDKIQKSGKAIEQYCSWNAPGEFSVRPVIKRVYIPGSTEYEKEVSFDTNALYYPTPVKYLQVEQQGPALTSTIYALGRRQEWDETEQCWKIGPSKILLPYQFITTQPNPLNRTTTPSKNFFCFPDEQVSMVTNNEALTWLFDKASQPLEQLKNAGMITIGDNWSNDTDNKSNPVPTETGVPKIRKDYFDTTWYPLSYENAHLGPYNTTGCVYSEDEMYFTNSDTMIDIMNKNAFIFNQQPIIPLSFYSTRPLYLRSIPLIGTIANFFRVGDIKLSSHTTNRVCSNLCFFGDADIMCMCANLNGQMGTSFKTGSKIFPINFFGTNETMYQKLGVNAVNTTFCFSLTDRIQLNTHGATSTYDTVLLAQSKNSDGTNIFADGTTLKANSSLKSVSPGNVGYIIDAVVVQSIFDGKIRLSCYGAEERDFIYPQWTATILSNANWENGNMRDWTNIFLLSNWEERFCVQQDEFTWPEAPHKEQPTDYKWDIRRSSVFLKTDAGSQPIGESWQSQDTRWSLSQLMSSPKGFKVEMTQQGTTENPRVFYNSTIPYTDLGIAAVTDKDTFISYFGNAEINCLGSFITTIHQVAGSKDKTYPIKNNVVGSINFESGVYSYTKPIDVITFRAEGKNNYPDSDLFYIREVGQVRVSEFYLTWKKTGEEFNGEGKYRQNFTLQLVLGEDGITTTLTDSSYAETITQNANFSGYETYSHSWEYGAATRAGINSTMRVDHILFHKR